eukprot:8695_1
MSTTVICLFIVIIGGYSYDFSGYKTKSNIVCDEFYDLNNWNISGNLATNYYTAKCPTDIASCGIITGSTTESDLGGLYSTLGYNDIEFAWDMYASYTSNNGVKYDGKYSCDGTKNGVKYFFRVDYANKGGGIFLNQYFKLPSQCNNQSQILVQIKKSTATNSNNEFRIDNFCIYGNQPTSDPTTDPTSDPTTDPTSDPTTDPTSDPASDPTSDPTTDPTSDPTTDPTSDPTTDLHQILHQILYQIQHIPLNQWLQQRIILHITIHHQNIPHIIH